MLELGSTAKLIRESKGLNTYDASRKLRVSEPFLRHLEADGIQPSTELIDRYREVFGVDIYVLAWCLNGDVESLPSPIREQARALTEAWKEQLGEIANQ